LNINTQELQPSFIINNKKKQKQNKAKKKQNKNKNKNKNKKPMKYTSATQFAICQMTNRKDLNNN